MLQGTVSNHSSSVTVDRVYASSSDDKTPKKDRLRKGVKQTAETSQIGNGTNNKDSPHLYYVDGRYVKLSEKDFEPSDRDPIEHFNEIYSNFKQRHRRIQDDTVENYENVFYDVSKRLIQNLLMGRNEKSFHVLYFILFFIHRGSLLSGC